MRANLRHTHRESRQRRREHGRRGARAHVASAAVPGRAEVDAAVARVRGAGGPMDHAAYACQCGYCFSAAVSTTVSCPHCGAAQAW
jgi:hypothetical protein